MLILSTGFSASIPWLTRLKIALGAAKGLAFLHEADKPIIYRDFKASNILLDSVSVHNCSLSFLVSMTANDIITDTWNTSIGRITLPSYLILALQRMARRGMTPMCPPGLWGPKVMPLLSISWQVLRLFLWSYLNLQVFRCCTWLFCENVAEVSILKQWNVEYTWCKTSNKHMCTKRWHLSFVLQVILQQQVMYTVLVYYFWSC